MHRQPCCPLPGARRRPTGKRLAILEKGRRHTSSPTAMLATLPMCLAFAMQPLPPRFASRRAAPHHSRLMSVAPRTSLLRLFGGRDEGLSRLSVGELKSLLADRGTSTSGTASRKPTSSSGLKPRLHGPAPGAQLVVVGSRRAYVSRRWSNSSPCMTSLPNRSRVRSLSLLRRCVRLMCSRRPPRASHTSRRPPPGWPAPASNCARWRFPLARAAGSFGTARATSSPTGT